MKNGDRIKQDFTLKVCDKLLCEGGVMKVRWHTYKLLYIYIGNRVIDSVINIDRVHSNTIPNKSLLLQTRQLRGLL